MAALGTGPCHRFYVWREATRKAARVTANASFKEWQRDFVAPLYRQARVALGDPQRMTIVQIDLMKHIYALQDTRKEQAKEDRAAMSDSGTAGRLGDRQKSKKRADDARYHETVRNAATFTIRELREIGDMLAWKTLHNRMTIRLMATKPAAGDLPPFDDYMATVKDAAGEADALRSYPLFTDTTNLLRHGDVLYIPWDGSRIVRMEELKGRSGGDPRRRQRQQQALQELDHLLNSGTGVFAGDLYHLRWCTVPLRHHFPKVAELIAKARAEGRADLRLSRNHAITIVDFTQEDRIDELLETMPTGPTPEELVEAQPDDDLFLAGLLPRIEEVMLPCAPWGVYPLPEQDRLDLASLRLWCRSTLNLSGFLRDVTAAGMPAEAVYDMAHKYAGIRVALPGMKNELDMTFLLVRVGIEFMDESVLTELLRSPALPPPPRGSKMMFEFRQEMSIWD